MSIVSNHFPEVIDEQNGRNADHEAWFTRVRHVQDRDYLIDFARAALSTAGVPCECQDGSCLRCQVEAILAADETEQDLADAIRREVRYV